MAIRIKAPATGAVDSLIDPPQRVLMAPGPSNLHPRVVQALGLPLLGHKDPVFLAIMDETAALLRDVFQTANRATFAMPATGGSAMDAALINLVEPGDTVVMARSGFFADRMLGIARRLPDVSVVAVGSKWGDVIDYETLAHAVREHRPRLLAVVHGETSTGVEQPLKDLGLLCRETDTLLVVDAVASLGGTSLPVDDLGLDVCYSGSQKCLSAPPGAAPITLSDRALDVLARRKTPVPSWYLDLTLHARFWDTEHIYHHTAPVLSVYALREALRLCLEEGLDARLARHRLHARALRSGLEAMGLRLFANPAHRLTPVTTVLAPPDVSAADVREVLLCEFNIEIAGGLGEYVDRMWRIGIMGHSAQRANVTLLLAALEAALLRQGYTPRESGVAAADAVYTNG